jgi:hypothetical protein
VESPGTSAPQHAAPSTKHRAPSGKQLLFLLLFACAPGSAAAQTPGWEIEGYGGVVAARTASEGSRTLPAPGPPLVTSSPIFPSHQVPTWFFGDGASLLNGVNGELGVAGRITPLDAAFAPLGSSRSGTAGVRVRRRFSDRVSAEISVDALTRSDDRVSDLAAAVVASRDSFKAAFGDLLRTGPFSGVAVDAASTAPAAARRRDTAVTLAVSARLTPWGPFVPYATFGGGVMTGAGSLPSASLEGRYRFSILGEVPIDETDRVSVRYTRRTSFVAVLGGGLRRDFSGRWSVRVDARVLAGPDTTRVLVDATPSAVRGTPADFIELFANPGVQFSNDPSTGRRSTLSGPALSAFEVFSGGLQARTLLTVGLVRRF